MADVRFLIQGFQPEHDLYSVIMDSKPSRGFERVLGGIAFVRDSGVSLIEPLLREYGSAAQVFAGIRNGITTVQGLFSLLRIGVQVYALDTGTISHLYHPKLLVFYGQHVARILVGSGNLTVGGLLSNVEATIALDLDLSTQYDHAILRSVLTVFENLVSTDPEHVRPINSGREAFELFLDGLLSDERVYHRPTSTPKRRKRTGDELQPMNLHIKQVERRSTSTATRAKKKRPTSISTSAAPDQWILLWESRPLNKRDLNIPDNNRTNRTGSMLLKKGAAENIDQRSHFREVVFADLDWKRDDMPGSEHYERAEAMFEIIIKGVHHGAYSLRLSHNTRTDTATYRQQNSMTQIHWGNARSILARTGLIGQNLRLYSAGTASSAFIIEIV